MRIDLQARHVLVALILTSCGDAPRTTEYFLAHPDELKAVLVACGQNSESANPECANARAADAQLATKRLSEEADRIADDLRERQEKRKRKK